MDIENLEAGLVRALAERDSLNDLPTLYALTSTDDPETLYRVVFALYRVFAAAFASSYYSHPRSADTLSVAKWLDGYIERYCTLLSGLLAHPVVDLRAGSLDISMSLFRLRSALKDKNGVPQVHYAYFRRAMTSILEDSASHEDTIRLFVDKWFNQYWDVRWIATQEIISLAKSSKDASESRQLRFTSNALTIFDKLLPLPDSHSTLLVALSRDAAEASKSDEPADDTDWRKFFDAPEAKASTSNSRPSKLTLKHVVHSPNAHEAHLAHCWVSLTPMLSSSAELSARALEILHRIPSSSPRHTLMLMDWISGCIDYGGSTGLLALNVMHSLMLHNNLDYPNFYTKLYQYLDPECLHTRHSSRFLRLLDQFLRSTHLPTTLLASYVKRLSRLSLSAPPSALVAVLPLLYNIMRQNAQLIPMIHDVENVSLEDPYLADQTSPYDSNALNSSLWEIASLRQHYNPAVSSLSQIFFEAFTKPSYQLEDFLDQSYGTIFRSDQKRVLKYEPVVSDTLEQNALPLWTI